MLELKVLDLAISLCWWNSKTGSLNVCLMSCCKVSENRDTNDINLKSHICQKSPMHVLNIDGISCNTLYLFTVCSCLLHLWWCCWVDCEVLGHFSFVWAFHFGGVVVILFGEGWEAILRGSCFFFVRWRSISLLLYNWQGRFFFYSIRLT